MDTCQPCCQLYPPPPPFSMFRERETRTDDNFSRISFQKFNPFFQDTELINFSDKLATRSLTNSSRGLFNFTTRPRFIENKRKKPSVSYGIRSFLLSEHPLSLSWNPRFISAKRTEFPWNFTENPSTTRVFRTRKCTSYASIAEPSSSRVSFISKKFRIPRRGIMDGFVVPTIHPRAISRVATRADETTRRMPVPANVLINSLLSKLL